MRQRGIEGVFGGCVVFVLVAGGGEGREARIRVSSRMLSKKGKKEAGRREEVGQAREGQEMMERV